VDGARDPFRRDAQTQCPPGQDAAEVHGGSTPGVRETEGPVYLRADLVAPAADGRSEVQIEPVRLEAEPVPGGVKCGFEYPLGDSAPAGVEEGDDAGLGVDERNRSTVGGSYQKEEPGYPGEVAVRRGGQTHSIVGVIVEVNPAPMDLTRVHHSLHSHRLLKELQPAQDSARGERSEEAEVKLRLRAKRGPLQEPGETFRPFRVEKVRDRTGPHDLPHHTGFGGVRGSGSGHG